jgi:hypothetical protein
MSLSLSNRGMVPALTQTYKKTYKYKLTFFFSLELAMIRFVLFQRYGLSAVNLHYLVRSCGGAFMTSQDGAHRCRL